MLKRLIIAALAWLTLAAASVSAQAPSPLSLKTFRHHAEGIDQVFEFEVANALDREVWTRGRVVVINVYDTSAPETILIEDLVVPPGGVAAVTVRWPDAPLVGQVRALLVLNDGRRPALIESIGFWIVPVFSFALFGLAALVIVLLALALLRLPGYIRERVPSNMLAYRVEFDDTVVTLSNRFEVTWQDVVRANRLKPPYALKPGSRVFIPKHALRKNSPKESSA